MTAVALGPGLGTAPDSAGLVHELYCRVAQPMVVDADGLNALAHDLDQFSSPVAPRILTPHPGEFQRLAGEKCATDRAERAAQAAKLCQRDSTGQTIVVLKGHQTIVTDGRQYAVNTTGNAGMATGGTGDCLTGVIVALLAQGLSPWEAARLGTHIHGLAGDLAAAELGQVSMIASDLVDYLPAAFCELAS
jgi:ADP-dependent NAD(P)H-hydrate dehydratase